MDMKCDVWELKSDRSSTCIYLSIDAAANICTLVESVHVLSDEEVPDVLVSRSPKSTS